MVNRFVMEPHTEAKHSILERYLGRWFPILSSHGGRLAYIDGFAGPGVYSRGERGSPIIALETANKYSGTGDFEASFWFIEPDPEHRESLREQVGGVDLKEGVRVEEILSSTFEESFPGIVESLQEGGGMPPTFAFVDPNGHTGVKMSTLTAFLQLRRCEFLFTFMERSLQRFIGLPEDVRKQKLDDLFGTDRWQDALAMKGSEQIRFFLELYTKQLKDNGVQHTQAFEMCNENEQTIYHLIFATNSRRGLYPRAQVFTAIRDSPA